MSTTRPPDRLRGNTPPRAVRPTQEYMETKAPREVKLSLPAELSQVNEIIREVISEILSERSESAESLIAARVQVDTRAKTRTQRWTIGGLVSVLLAMGGWAIAEVRSYGDERVAAYEAKAESRAAASRVDEAHKRIDDLEGKVDSILAAVGRIEQADVAEPMPVPILVPSAPKVKRAH